MPNDREIFNVATQKGESCLPLTALETLAAGEGTADERRHLGECPHCHAEVALLRSFLEDAPSPAEAAVVRQITRNLEQTPAWRPAAKASWWALPRIWAPSLAGAIALLAIGLYLQNPATVPPAEDQVRSGQIEGLQPLGDLAQPPVELRWRTVPGAVQYQVRLTDIENSTLWQDSTAEPKWTVPVGANQLMTKNRTLTWTILALNSRGETVATSNPQTFRVTRQ